LEVAVSMALQLVEGTYGIAVAHADHPGMLVGARHGSPLVIGVGSGEYFLASDVAAILGHTRPVVYLNDGEMAVLTRAGYHPHTIDRQRRGKEVGEGEREL